MFALSHQPPIVFEREMRQYVLYSVFNLSQVIMYSVDHPNLPNLGLDYIERVIYDGYRGGSENGLFNALILTSLYGRQPFAEPIPIFHHSPDTPKLSKNLPYSICQEVTRIAVIQQLATKQGGLMCCKTDQERGLHACCSCLRGP